MTSPEAAGQQLDEQDNMQREAPAQSEGFPCSILLYNMGIKKTQEQEDLRNLQQLKELIHSSNNSNSNEGQGFYPKFYSFNGQYQAMKAATDQKNVFRNASSSHLKDSEKVYMKNNAFVKNHSELDVKTFEYDDLAKVLHNNVNQVNVNNSDDFNNLYLQVVPENYGYRKKFQQQLKKQQKSEYGNKIDELAQKLFHKQRYTPQNDSLKAKLIQRMKMNNLLNKNYLHYLQEMKRNPMDADKKITYVVEQKKSDKQVNYNDKRRMGFISESQEKPNSYLTRKNLKQISSKNGLSKAEDINEKSLEERNNEENSFMEDPTPPQHKKSNSEPKSPLKNQTQQKLAEFILRKHQPHHSKKHSNHHHHTHHHHHHHGNEEDQLNNAFQEESFNQQTPTKQLMPQFSAHHHLSVDVTPIKANQSEAQFQSAKQQVEASQFSRDSLLQSLQHRNSTSSASQISMFKNETPQKNNHKTQLNNKLGTFAFQISNKVMTTKKLSNDTHQNTILGLGKQTSDDIKQSLYSQLQKTGPANKQSMGLISENSIEELLIDTPQNIKLNSESLAQRDIKNGLVFNFQNKLASQHEHLMKQPSKLTTSSIQKKTFGNIQQPSARGSLTKQEANISIDKLNNQIINQQRIEERQQLEINLIDQPTKDKNSRMKKIKQLLALAQFKAKSHVQEVNEANTIFQTQIPVKLLPTISVDTEVKDRNKRLTTETQHQYLTSLQQMNSSRGHGTLQTINSSRRSDIHNIENQSNGTLSKPSLASTRGNKQSDFLPVNQIKTPLNIKMSSLSQKVPQAPFSTKMTSVGKKLPKESLLKNNKHKSQAIKSAQNSGNHSRNESKRSNLDSKRGNLKVDTQLAQNLNKREILQKSHGQKPLIKLEKCDDDDEQ